MATDPHPDSSASTDKPDSAAADADVERPARAVPDSPGTPGGTAGTGGDNKLQEDLDR